MSNEEFIEEFTNRTERIKLILMSGALEKGDITLCDYVKLLKSTGDIIEELGKLIDKTKNK